MERNMMMPGNPRYQPKDLVDVFGYDNLYKNIGHVEIATLESLGEIGVIPIDVIQQLTPEIIEKLLAIRTTDVDKVERSVTHHDIRAWVRIAQDIVGDDLKKWIHIPLTSYDVIDTGRVLQFREGYESALFPALIEVVGQLADIVEEYADTVQIGRTHGQHALPITVGFWLATILHRLVHNWEQLDRCSRSLVGKISGPVGAHNAQVCLGITKLANDADFEKHVLEKLRLYPCPISTQILPPEPMANFLFACISISATLGQFGRDCRHLMRTEINEIAEAFEVGQVGSSTMAQKRNPIRFENLEGMWVRSQSEFLKVMQTLMTDHQRDLVNSSVYRDFPIILINLQQQLDTLLRKNASGKSFLQRLVINEIACQKNIEMSSKVILAEPVYVALQMAGYPSDAHELVNRKVVPLAQERDVPLVVVVEEMANSDADLEAALKAMPADIWNLLHSPLEYVGDASSKALEIATLARQTISRMTR